MAYADDLLSQAVHLANLDHGKPRQVNLRRATSTAYYSLFHLLIADSAHRFSPRTPQKLTLRIARAFVHSEMRQVCVTISKGHQSAVIDSLNPSGFSPEVRFVAETFVELQNRRHIADYDLSLAFTRVRTLNSIDLARRSFAAWARKRASDEANVFLAALLFNGRWAK